MCYLLIMTNISIHDFDLKKIDERRKQGSSPVVLIIGGRGRGKSNIAKAVMRVLQNVPMGCVFSGTEDSNPFYCDNVPALFTFSSFDEAVIKRIIEKQKRSEEKRDVFILLDDLMYDPGFLKQPLMRSIFLNGRHLRITLVITTQYAIDIPCALRGNVDFVFLLRENNIQTCHKLYKNFGGIFPNPQVFSRAMGLCTTSFGAMVINNVDETACQYRVDIESEKEHFRMFCDSVWKYAEAHTVAQTDEMDIVEEGTHRLLLEK